MLRPKDSQKEVGKTLKRIGVLALQGSFELHKPHIEALGASYHEVRKKGSLENLDALILPGGESSVILKLLSHTELYEEVRNFVYEKPSWGICAGLVLLAKEVEKPKQESFAVLPIKVIRNYYGSHLESFEEEIGSEKVSYIRAPGMELLSDTVTVKHTRNKKPVWIDHKNLMATTFHPELSKNSPSLWHKVFFEKI